MQTEAEEGEGSRMIVPTASKSPMPHGDTTRQMWILAAVDSLTPLPVTLSVHKVQRAVPGLTRLGNLDC